MLLTAMIWGSVFVAQSTGMEHIGPFLFSGARFLLAAVILLPLFFWRPGKQAAPSLSRGLIFSGILLGLVLTAGINFQQVGLQFTTVTNSGFITGLYVILVPIIGLLFGMRTGFGTWLGAILAVIGMLLLSVGADFRISEGDWLQLAGAFIWAAHVLLIGVLARRYDPLQLAWMQVATCGVLSMLFAACFETVSWSGIYAAGPSLLYAAVLGVSVSYTLQLIAQRDALASHAAVIFSLEAVFAAIAGAVVLGEVLSMRGYLGCALMLGGMIVAQLWPKKTAAST